MKMKKKAVSGIIGGLLFVFVITLNLNFSHKNDLKGSNVSMQSLKFETAQGSEWCMVDLAAWCCRYLGHAEGIDCGLTCTCD
jgi:hypothetical protein